MQQNQLYYVVVEHQLIALYLLNTIMKMFFYLSVVNNRTYSFLERIKNAYNALFGFESEVIEIVLEKDHAEKIIDIMNQISKD